MKTVKAGKKSIKVTWTKDSKSIGYQIGSGEASFGSGD